MRAADTQNKPTRPADQRVPLVLIPGLNCTGAVFAGLLGRLWEHGPVSIASHWPGADIGTMAEAVLASAPQRFALTGYSMGGYIAFEIWRRAPERVAGLCFLASSARPNPEEQVELRERQIALAEQGRTDLIYGPAFANNVHEANRDNAGLFALYRDMAERTGPEIYIRHQRAIMARADSRPDLGRIGCPTASIVGQADIVTGVDAAREIAEGVPGATLRVIPGAGHLLPLEQPDATAEALLEWRARV